MQDAGLDGAAPWPHGPTCSSLQHVDDHRRWRLATCWPWWRRADERGILWQGIRRRPAGPAMRGAGPRAGFRCLPGAAPSPRPSLARNAWARRRSPIAADAPHASPPRRCLGRKPARRAVGAPSGLDGPERSGRRPRQRRTIGVEVPPKRRAGLGGLCRPRDSTLDGVGPSAGLPRPLGAVESPRPTPAVKRLRLRPRPDRGLRPTRIAAARRLGRTPARRPAIAPSGLDTPRRLGRRPRNGALNGATGPAARTASRPAPTRHAGAPARQARPCCRPNRRTRRGSGSGNPIARSSSPSDRLDSTRAADPLSFSAAEVHRRVGARGAVWMSGPVFRRPTP